MLSRSYRTKVELLNFIEKPDGYGGFTGEYESVGKYWADIKSVSLARKIRDVGLNVLKNPIYIYIRYHAYEKINENTRVKISDKTYSIVGVENKDLENRFIQILLEQNNSPN